MNRLKEHVLHIITGIVIIGTMLHLYETVRHAIDGFEAVGLIVILAASYFIGRWIRSIYEEAVARTQRPQMIHYSLEDLKKSRQ